MIYPPLVKYFIVSRYVSYQYPFTFRLFQIGLGILCREFNNLFPVGAQYGTMACANGADIEGFYLFDGFQQEFAEWFQNDIVVILKSLTVIAHQVIEHIGMAEVCAKRVTGKEHLILL
ncbi:MAG: hypothetical protein BWY70_00300 [Bacteroidetes bacterium ADurb.Bin408]|nr:MAG: hypothetical protein BWY70_00300 [Bacteroidetes bacterium ADurb.Bin408]